MIFWEIKMLISKLYLTIISSTYPLEMLTIMCFLYLRNERISGLPSLAQLKVSSRRSLTPRPDGSVKVKWRVEQWSSLLEWYMDSKYRSQGPEFHQDQNLFGISVCGYLPQMLQRTDSHSRRACPPQTAYQNFREGGKFENASRFHNTILYMKKKRRCLLISYMKISNRNQSLFEESRTSWFSKQGCWFRNIALMFKLSSLDWQCCVGSSEIRHAGFGARLSGFKSWFYCLCDIGKLPCTF